MLVFLSEIRLRRNKYLPHALPNCCLETGSVSTMRLRQQHCTDKSAKSPEHEIQRHTDVDREIHRIYTADCDNNVPGWFLVLRQQESCRQRLTRTASGRGSNFSTISAVQPMTNRHTATARDPISMNGRRRPYFDRELSAMTPTNGCTINPERGPAIQTADIRLLERPKERRYGVPSSFELSAMRR